MSSSQIIISSNPKYHGGDHRYVVARRGNTYWTLEKKESLMGLPVQLEMALPMTLPYPSKQIVSVQVSNKHLVKLVNSPKGSYYEIDLPLDSLEYCL